MTTWSEGAREDVSVHEGSGDTGTPSVADETRQQEFRNRIQSLSRTIQSAEAWREIAVYGAVKAGATVRSVAGWATVDVTSIDRMVASCEQDPGIEGPPERPYGPEFVLLYPHGY